MDVEIWSDVACPWCYIGKRRFETALEQFEHADAVNVTWRSFELDPQAPDETPGDIATVLSHKYGVPLEQAREMNGHVTELALAEGLDYRLQDQRLGSTFDAHRLIHLAKAHGLQDQMKERLLRARLCEGRLISDPEVLAECAAEVGLEAGEVRELVVGDRFADAVRDDEETARRLGIAGVPMFVVDRALGASGAQPPELLVALLERGWENAGAAGSQR